MYQFTNVAVFSECFIKYKQTICFGSLPRKNLSNANLSYAVMAETFVNRKKSLRKCEICQKLRIKIPRNFDMIIENTCTSYGASNQSTQRRPRQCTCVNAARARRRSKMASFSIKSFDKKLKEMSSRQDSVQTLSLWLIHHRAHSRAIVNLWLDRMKKGKNSRFIL